MVRAVLLRVGGGTGSNSKFWWKRRGGSDNFGGGFLGIQNSGEGEGGCKKRTIEFRIGG